MRALERLRQAGRDKPEPPPEVFPPAVPVDASAARYHLVGSYGTIVGHGIPGTATTAKMAGPNVRREFTLGEAVAFLRAVPRGSGIYWRAVLVLESTDT